MRRLILDFSKGLSMLYSFQFETTELDKWRTILVSDGMREYELVARKGHQKHVYMNLPVSRRPTLIFPTQGKYTELSFGGESYFTEEQARLNRNLDTSSGTPYISATRGKPRRAVVTFPHFKGQGGWPAPFSILNGEQLELDDCLYLSFQDPYFNLGSYLLSDNHGNDPKPGVVQAIRKELAAHGLTEDSLTILGSSKGAATSVMVSEYFERNNLIVCSLSTNLDVPIRQSKYNHIGVALDFFGVSYPSTISLLLSEAEKKRTHWFYSLNDFASNQGNETKQARHLTKHACESGHSNVLSDNLPLIGQVIDSFSPHD